MSAGNVDVSGILEQNKAAVPGIGVLSGPLGCDERIIGTGDDDGLEWKALQRNRTESGWAGRIVGSVRIAGRYQKRAAYFSEMISSGHPSPVRDERVRGTVCNKNDWTGLGGDDLVKLTNPIRTARCIPFFLLHAATGRVPSLPMTLPVIRAGAANARQNQGYKMIGHAYFSLFRWETNV